MSEKKFVDGLIVKAPHDRAPDFVKCSISIKRKDLGNWLRGQSEDWINLDVKVSQQGKWYAEVNEWKPQDSHNEAKSNGYAPQKDDFSDDLPF
jgi:hypothetical protein